MSLKLASRFVALVPAVIADVQENDTATHDLDISDSVPPETKAILIRVERVTGTGDFEAYPRGDTYSFRVPRQAIHGIALVPIKDQTLKWKNSIANDNYEVWLLGYFVQRRTD